MWKRVLLLAAAISISVCEAAPKRPLDAANNGKLRGAAVYAQVDERGFGVQFVAQDGSDPTGQSGVLGGVLVAAINAGANAPRIEVASSRAARLSQSFNHERTAAQFGESLQAQLAQPPLLGAAPTIQALDGARKWEAEQFPEPAAVLAKVEYSLTQDLRSLEVVLNASAVSKDAVKIRKRGNRKGKPDEGIVYRNRLEYRSTPLAAHPEKTAQQVDAEIEQIKEKYSQANLSKSRDRSRANMTTAERESAIKKEIARARQYPPEFLAEYYMNMWLANDAELLRNELQAGLAGVAELLARDLQDATVVDKSSRPDKSTVVAGDKRVVSRMNWLPFEGSLVSEPLDYTRPASNAIAYAREERAEAAPPADAQ
jgi:hypothetical protein